MVVRSPTKSPLNSPSSRNKRKWRPSRICIIPLILIMGLAPLLGNVSVIARIAVDTNSSSVSKTKQINQGDAPAFPSKEAKQPLITSAPSIQIKESIEEPIEAKDKTPSLLRELRFEDLKLGPFLSQGAINIVAAVGLPEWWYRQHQISSDAAFVIKLAPGGDWYISQGDREVEIWETLARDSAKAKQHKILPLIFGRKNFTNPFRFNNDTNFDSFPSKLRKRLRQSPNLVAMVMPYRKLPRPSQQVENLNDIKRFIKTLLETLEYAHSLGINNFDLSENNVRIDESGDAIVMDWNAAKKMGQDIFDPTADLWITAPEGMLEVGIKQVSMSAMDVWSVGVMLVNLSYRPCQWINSMHKPRGNKFPMNHDLIAYTLEKVGGETIIDISDSERMDLAETVGLNRSTVLQKEFEIPLINGPWQCDTKTFDRLQSATQDDLGEMHSFLKSAMKISPLQRANATALLQHPFLRDFVPPSKSSSGDEDATEETLMAKKYLGTASPVSNNRQLKFSDITIGKFLGKGAINLVSTIELPEWFYLQEQIPKDMQFVVKLAAGGHWRVSQGDREVEIFETLWQDPVKAERLQIVPSYFSRKKFPNPFRDPKTKIPEGLPEKYELRLRHEPHLVAIVLPFLDLDDPSDQIKTLHQIQIFTRSLLTTLVYAHSVGINNFDLSDNNVKIDDDYQAIVTDWNAAKKMGQEIFDETANLWITAPEGMIEYVGEHDILQTSMSAMDIWGVGIFATNMAFRPCMFTNPRAQAKRAEYPVNYNLIRETVQSLGGETIIDIGAGNKVDLAELVGLNRTLVKEKEFELPLHRGSQECDFTTFPSLRNATNRDLANFHSFLKTALRVSPAERPDAATLLQHPFFTNSTWGIEESSSSNDYLDGDDGDDPNRRLVARKWVKDRR